MLKKGDGVDVDKGDAFRYFRLVTDWGHLKALRNCGVILANGEVDKEEAEQFMKMTSSKRWYGGNKIVKNINIQIKIYLLYINLGMDTGIDFYRIPNWYRYTVNTGIFSHGNGK